MAAAYPDLKMASSLRLPTLMLLLHWLKAVGWDDTSLEFNEIRVEIAVNKLIKKRKS